jgi:hypothetical protein
MSDFFLSVIHMLTYYETNSIPRVHIEIECTYVITHVVKRQVSHVLITYNYNPRFKYLRKCVHLLIILTAIDSCC